MENDSFKASMLPTTVVCIHVHEVVIEYDDEDEGVD